MKFKLSYDVEAEIMTKEEYCEMRGWIVADNQNPDEVGFAVTCKRHLTWMSKEEFNEKLGE